MWIKWNCPFCQSAQDEMRRQKVSYTVHVMDDEIEKLDKLREVWDWPTVPLVTTFRDGEEVLVGGYDDLKTWFDEAK
jgi:glutaredoxin